MSAAEIEPIESKNKLTNVKIGRKPRRAVKKPYLKNVLDAVGAAKIAKELKIFPSRISNWVYTDVAVPRIYAQIISEITAGIIKPSEINKKYRIDKDASNNEVN